MSEFASGFDNRGNRIMSRSYRIRLGAARFRLRHDGDSGIVRVSQDSGGLGCVAHDFSARSA
jgi:hypothetical protein